MRYGVPRNLDVPEQLVPGFTLAQAVSLALGIAVAVAAWAAGLPEWLKWWVVLYAPLVGFLATRRAYLPGYRGHWTWLQLAGAWLRYAARPRRTIWKGGER